MKKLIVVLAGFLAASLSFSQTVAQTSNTLNDPSSFFDVETDPLAYILDGYSLHVGYSKNKSRWNVGFVGFEYPENFNDNAGITARTNGLSLKWDYISPKLKGFYVGLQSDLSRLKLTSIDDNTQVKTLFQATFGLRAGYRLMFGSENGFYLNAWAANIFNTKSDDVVVGNTAYEIPAYVIFPTVHLGWKF